LLQPFSILERQLLRANLAKSAFPSSGAFFSVRTSTLPPLHVFGYDPLRSKRLFESLSPSRMDFFRRLRRRQPLNGSTVSFPPETAFLQVLSFFNVVPGARPEIELFLFPRTPVSSFRGFFPLEFTGDEPMKKSDFLLTKGLFSRRRSFPQS